MSSAPGGPTGPPPAVPAGPGPSGAGDGTVGRARQRMRTRRELLRAAQRLMEAGASPTVAEAADAADVSRATAYRYFPSQDALLAEAALPSGLVGPDELFGGWDAPADVEDRVVLVHDVLYAHIRSREAQFRHFLRAQLLSALSQGPGTAQRPGFRIGLLDAALAPLADELPPAALERLRNALAVLIGTEAVVVVRDVLHLDDDAARAQGAWACRALVRAALAEDARG